MKQTAVEWLVDRLNDWELKYAKAKEKISKDVYESTKIYFKEKAKEMEKDQIIEAFLDGAFDTNAYPDVAERYYNETFKTK
jgi:hypothetical protein